MGSQTCPVIGRAVDTLELEQHRRFGRACPAFRLSLAQRRRLVLLLMAGNSMDWNQTMLGLALNDVLPNLYIYIYGDGHFPDRQRWTEFDIRT